MAIKSINVLKSCRLCKSESIIHLWELNPSPYGDLFCKSKNNAKSLQKIDLTLQMCESCKFVQLGQKVDIDKIYKKYLYNTTTTSGLPSFYSRLSSSLISSLISSLNLIPTNLIVDVGSNDGTALTPYLERGFKVLGIEPAGRPAEKAIASGVNTINSYLDLDAVSETLTKYGRAKLVMANYVSANVPDPISFFKHLKNLLSDDGAISIVTGYHPDQFSINMFEYINHDHLSYFSIQSAVNLANLVGLKLMSAEKIEHKGGSVHLIFMSSKSNTKPNESVNQLLQREKWMKVDRIDFYDDLKKRIKIEKQRIQASLPERGLIGIGASISTTHLLHQFEIGDRFETLIDDNKNKIDTFSPGFGIPVEPINSFKFNKNNLLVLLAWQHEQVLLNKLSNLSSKPQIFIPLPNAHYHSTHK